MIDRGHIDEPGTLNDKLKARASFGGSGDPDLRRVGTGR
jgi:hypothetical protein